VARLSLTRTDVGFDCSITMKGTISAWTFLADLLWLEALAYKSVFNFFTYIEMCDLCV